MIKRAFSFLFWKEEIFKHGTLVEVWLPRSIVNPWKEYDGKHDKPKMFVIIKMTNTVTGKIKFRKEYL